MVAHDMEKASRTVDVHTLVITGFGINCDNETAHAFQRAGSKAERVHLNDLIADPALLDRFQILAVPGGFSFGDDVASGRIFANRLRYRLGDALQAFVAAGKLAIGICNGFQVLVKMGMLPLFDGEFRPETTLTHNDSGRFEDRWVQLTADPATSCVWLGRGVENGTLINRIELPVRHGEGKFIPQNDAVLERLRANGQVALRYTQPDGVPARGDYPANPNGSVDDIAAICDPSGRIFGLMPHPEAYTCYTHHPCWTRRPEPECPDGAGLGLFRNAVRYAQDKLL